MTYAPYERCTACAGRAQPGAVNLLKYLINKYPYTKSLGIYNCRYIAGTTTLSNHSCGCAVDLFIPNDGWGKPLTQYGNPIVQFLYSISTEVGLTEQIYAKVRYDRNNPTGKAYGGVHPHHDHIHFSITKAKGVSLTYAQIVAAAGEPVPDEGDEVTLKRGDKGAAVTKFQQALMNERSGSLPQYGADGDFGGETEAAVKDYQGRADLAVTGQIDGVTGSLLLEYMADRVGGTSGVDQTARSAAAAAQTTANAAKVTADSAQKRLNSLRDFSF